MGTQNGDCLGWGARPAHPEKLAMTSERTRLIPVTAKPSAVQRTGHTEAIHRHPDSTALQTRELAGQVTERVAPGASEGAGQGS